MVERNGLRGPDQRVLADTMAHGYLKLNYNLELCNETETLVFFLCDFIFTIFIWITKFT